MTGVRTCASRISVITVSMSFFFFKQKTAYEIYQCDWSSDVCSSDLQFLNKPFQGNFELEGLRRGLQNPGADLVTKIKKRWHGDWVTQPDQGHRYRQVGVDEYCQECGGQHLERYRHTGHEQANGKRTGYRVAVEVPQVGVVQQGTENL